MSKDKTLIQYPCDYPIKIVAYNVSDVHLQVTALIQKHCPELSSDQVSVRFSKDSKYQSITAAIVAKDEAHISLLVTELKTIKDVIMIL